MIPRLLLVLVVTCGACGSSRSDEARAAVVRQRVRAKLDARRVALDAELADVAGRLATARDDVTRAANPQAAQAKADLISTQYDELLARARQVGEDTLAESVRIDALPDRCFTKPYPTDCKLAPELLPAD